MKASTAFLVSPVSEKLPIVDDADYIGVDAGVLLIQEQGLPVKAAIGDFDSMDETTPILSDKVIRYPVRKDTTDMESAIEFAVEQGYTRIIVWGAISRRLDHTLANISLMVHRFPKIILADDKQQVFLMEPGLHIFEAGWKHVSFFPLEDSRITLEGFEYPLFERDLFPRDIYTVSNHVEKRGTAKLDFGRLICVQSNYE